MRIVALLFALAAVGTASVAGWQATQHLRAATRVCAALVQTRTQCAADVAKLEARLALAQQHEAERRSAIARIQVARTAASSAALASKPAPDRNAADWPQKVQTAFEQKRRQYAQASAQAAPYLTYRAAALFAGFFHDVGFTAAQSDQFLAIFVHGETQLGDLKSLVLDELIAGDDPVISQMAARINAEREAALTVLLAPTGHTYGEFFDGYVGVDRISEGARSMAAGIAGTAVLAGTPFSAAQLEQLTQIIRSATTVTPHSFGGAFMYNVDWARVDAQARAVLSDAQSTVFTTLPGTNGNGAYGGGRFDNVFRRAMFDAARSETEREKTVVAPRG